MINLVFLAGELFIATEFCENGSLLSYLRMNRYACENPLFYAELMHSKRESSLSAETSFIDPIAFIKAAGELVYKYTIKFLLEYYNDWKH